MNSKFENSNLKSQNIIDCHTHVGISISNYIASQSYPYAMSVEDLVVRMDLLGIDASAVFPLDSSYYPLYGGKNKVCAEVASKFPYEKENRNLLYEVYDVFPQYSGRLYPFVMFDPSQETRQQAAHLEKLSKHYKIYGLKTVTTYIKSFVSDFMKNGNPIREFARNMKIPVTFHSSWTDTDPYANVFDVLRIAEKNPELRICLAHSARFSKRALDIADSLPNCFVDTSAFKIHCDLAAQDSFIVPKGKERFEADYRCPGKVMSALLEYYPDTIIWGSDTPCHYFIRKYTDSTGNVIDVKLSASYDDEIKILKSLPLAGIRKISNVNTLKFLFGDGSNIRKTKS